MKHICKKSLSLVLTLAMLLSLMVPAAFADEAAAGTPEITVGSATVSATDGTVTLPVEISNNPGIASITLQFNIPADWKMTKISFKGTIFRDEDGEPIGSSSYSLTTGKLAWGWGELANLESNGKLCEITYKLPDGIVSGEYSIGVIYSYANTWDATGTNISGQFTFTSGTVTVTDGVNVSEVTPVLTGPADAEYTYAPTAPTVTPLKVEVSVEKEGELSYQWYCGATKIDNATANTYTPSLPAVGSSASYFCVVTNTYQGIAYTANSNMATIVYNMAAQETLGINGAGTVTYGETATYTTSGGSGDGALTWSVVPSEDPSCDTKGAATIDGSGVLTPTTVGTVTVKVSKASDGNYEEASAGMDVVIDPAELTLTGSESYAVTAYTTKKPVTLTVPTATAKNDQPISKSWNVTGNVTLDEQAKTVTATDDAKAGDTATVTLTYSAPNHNDKTVTWTITIQDKNDVSGEMTFTAKDANEVYNGTAKTVDTFVNNATITGDYSGTITYTLKDSSGAILGENTDLSSLSVTDAGEYTVTATYSDDENEGSITLTFSVARAKVDKPTAVTGLGYTGNAQDGVAYTENAGYTMSGQLTGTDAGSYVATATLDGNHCWNDGSTDVLTINWSIAKAQIDVSSYSWDYTAPFTYSGSAYSVAVKDADTTLVGITLGGDYSAINAGKYTATATATPLDGKNYEVINTISDCKWEILPAQIDVSGVTFTQSDIRWDGTAHTVSVSDLPAHVTVTYSGTYTASDAGTYNATAVLAPESTNYTLSGETTLTLTWNILRANVTSVPSAVSGLGYTGAEQTGVQYVENAGYSMSGTLTATNAGNYAATATLDKNHQWSEGDTAVKTINWTIGRKSVTLDGQTVSLRYSNTDGQTYTAAQVKTLLGDTNPDTTVEMTAVSTSDADAILAADALLADNTVTYALKDGLTADDAGKTAALTISYSSNNFENGTLTLTVTVMDKEDVSANISFTDGSSTYDGTEKTWETAIISGITAGENAKWTYTCTQNNAPATMKDAGSYTVTATYEDDDNFGTATAVYTIDPAELTVSGASVETKTYDGTATASVTDVTFSGLVSGESVGYEVKDAAFDNANAGTGKTVSFTVALDAAVTNYTLKSANATAYGMIEARTITVTLGDLADATYTGSDITPEVSVTATGTVNGYELEKDKDYSVIYANNRNVGAATVTVTCISGGNYTFDDATTGFAINAAALSGIKANNLVLTYTGESIPASSITGTAYFNGNEVSGTWSWVTEPDGVNASETPYTARVRFTPESENLTAAEADITVTINKATPTGEPSYTKIMSGGKMLADAQLGIGTITPAGGTIIWVDGDGNELPADTTEAKPFVSYGWCYIPADTTNYNLLTGTLVPCEYKAVPELALYDVNVAQSEGGTVTASCHQAAAGTTVSLTVTAAEGYMLKSVSVQDKTGRELAVAALGNGRYSFTMPNSSVSVSATFSGEAATPDTPVTGAFTDVPAGSWYYDAVYAAVEAGLFNGTSDTTFAPDTAMTRAMLVTVLWRMSGEPAAEAPCGFTDVVKNEWYEKAIDWASAESIVNGVGDNLFAPNNSISREQLATILFRYAQKCGLDTSARADLSSFTDVGAVSVYAQDAMSWAVSVGLISGVGNGQLDPTGAATRAQVATILLRFQSVYAL